MKKLICADIGNTSVRFALYSEGDSSPRIRRSLYLNAYPLIDEIFSDDSVRTVYISSVNKKAGDEISHYLMKKYDVAVRYASDCIGNQIINKYDDPMKLGEDRLCNAVAAAILYKDQDKIVIDAGTAVNFEVIEGGNVFVGGAIMPGIDLSALSLFSGTSKIENTALAFPEKIIGRNTAENISSGIYFGLISAINGWCCMAEKSAGRKFVKILTGGSAEILKSHIDDAVYHPDLTIHGLHIIALDDMKVK